MARQNGDLIMCRMTVAAANAPGVNRDCSRSKLAQDFLEWDRDGGRGPAALYGSARSPPGGALRRGDPRRWDTGDDGTRYVECWNVIDSAILWSNVLLVRLAVEAGANWAPPSSIWTRFGWETSSMDIEKADLYRSQLIQGSHDRVQGPKADCSSIAVLCQRTLKGKNPWALIPAARA